MSHESPDANPERLTLVTPSWMRHHKSMVAELREARKDAPKVLLIAASQHPLVDGKPGPEFEKRLAAADARRRQLSESGIESVLFSPGSRHYDAKSGVADDVALYDAAGLWLLERGVPASSLRGKDWNDKYMPGGVYNGASEIGVSAAAFKDDPTFHHAEYICSPGQERRARLYALAYVVPVDIVVPESLKGRSDESEMFHSSHVQNFALGAMARMVDPYGRVVDRLTQDRRPEDGVIDTLPEPALLSQFAQLPWYFEVT